MHKVSLRASPHANSSTTPRAGLHAHQSVTSLADLLMALLLTAVHPARAVLALSGVSADLARVPAGRGRRRG